MDVLLQFHGAKKIFPIPEGLKELMSDIVREVLRHQPECIHGFIAEYLETMLIVREKARDSAVVVSDVFNQGYFFGELYRTKKVTREAADAYASIIQAAWRGYVVRKKFQMYIEKRRRIQEEKELKKSIEIENFLESLGITYEEATRAACIIQNAYREAREAFGEKTWTVGEGIPLGQRIREADRSRGRHDRWEKSDWGDFFDMDEEGEIVYEWPRLKQLFKIPRDMVTPDMDIVQFFAMRDLEGKEQYTYLIEPQEGRNPRGIPIGFLIPLPRDFLEKPYVAVRFINPKYATKLGSYSYAFERTIERQDLNEFAAILKERKLAMETIHEYPNELHGEFDLDPDWVVPRILIQIQKEFLTVEDEEVEFIDRSTAPEVEESYTFRAETVEMSLKLIQHIINTPCGSVGDALENLAKLAQYNKRLTGRFLAVENFESPKYIQKVVIQPETETGEYENQNMDNFQYVFVPKGYKWRMKHPKPENPITVPMTRFQGHHSNYRGSAGLENQIFIMGPMLHSPDGKPITHQAIFWEEFGLESWYQLLCSVAKKKIARVNEGLLDIVEEEESVDEETPEETEEETEVAYEVTKQATAESITTEPIYKDEITEQEPVTAEPAIEVTFEVEEPTEEIKHVEEMKSQDMQEQDVQEEAVQSQEQQGVQEPAEEELQIEPESAPQPDEAQDDAEKQE